MGVGAMDVFNHQEGRRHGDVFEGLTRFVDRADDRVFGHLSYDLKNEVEPLDSRHPDRCGFPLAHWFVPRFLFELGGGTMRLLVHAGDREEGLRLLHALTATHEPPVPPVPSGHWRLGTERATYLEQARRSWGTFSVAMCTN